MLGYNVWDTISCSVSLICRIAGSDKFKVTAEQESHKPAVWNLLSPNSQHYWPLTGAWEFTKLCLWAHSTMGQCITCLGKMTMQYKPGKCSLFPLLLLPAFSSLFPNSPLDYLEVHQAMVFGIHLKKLSYPALAPLSRDLWITDHLGLFLYLHNWTGEMCFKIKQNIVYMTFKVKGGEGNREEMLNWNTAFSLALSSHFLFEVRPFSLSFYLALFFHRKILS